MLSGDLVGIVMGCQLSMKLTNKKESVVLKMFRKWASKHITISVEVSLCDIRMNGKSSSVDSVRLKAKITNKKFFNVSYLFSMNSLAGRWIDFKNDYKTLYPWFMESVWWVFKQLYEKGFVYRGVKVMPYSTACCTPLSNFEANQNYKEVDDPAVMVSFALDEDPSVSLVAWTTTPWTLPSNLALCVNPDLDYVKLRDVKRNTVYILMAARIQELYKAETDYAILET